MNVADELQAGIKQRAHAAAAEVSLPSIVSAGRLSAPIPMKSRACRALLSGIPVVGNRPGCLMNAQAL